MSLPKEHRSHVFFSTAFSSAGQLSDVRIRRQFSSQFYHDPSSTRCSSIHAGKSKPAPAAPPPPSTAFLAAVIPEGDTHPRFHCASKTPGLAIKLLAQNHRPMLLAAAKTFKLSPRGRRLESRRRFRSKNRRRRRRASRPLDPARRRQK